MKCFNEPSWRRDESDANCCADGHPFKLYIFPNIMTNQSGKNTDIARPCHKQWMSKISTHSSIFNNIWSKHAMPIVYSQCTLVTQGTITQSSTATSYALSAHTVRQESLTSCAQPLPFQEMVSFHDSFHSFLSSPLSLHSSSFHFAWTSKRRRRMEKKSTRLHWRHTASQGYWHVTIQKDLAFLRSS